MEAPERIEVVGGEMVALAWPDGLTAELSAQQLRDACACADCRADDTSRRTLRLVVPMLVTITDAEIVGGYGLRFSFAPDGHHTGIFTFDQLRELADTSGTNT